MDTSITWYFVFGETFIKMFHIQNVYAPSFWLCKGKKKRIDQNGLLVSGDGNKSAG